MIAWHRLFGIALTELFADSPFVVELEKDLSLKRQLLDVVIIRRREGEVSVPLPDGLDNLSSHNLISYKSLNEPLDDWTLDELVGHYVNYRKQVSPATDELLPTDRFQLYGVSTRFPQSLAGRVALESLTPGVYQTRWGTHVIRVLILSEMADQEHNAVWNLFSGVREKVVVGVERHWQRTHEMSTIFSALFENYQLEGIAVPYTMEDFRREVARETLKRMTPEERMEGLPPTQRLRGLPPAERLRGLPPAERLQGLSAEEILQQLSPEEIRAYLARHEERGSS